MFVLEPETGSFSVKAGLMDHKEEIIYKLDVIVYNNVTRPLAANFTIEVDITSERLIPSNFTYIVEEEKEPPVIDLPEPTETIIEVPVEEPPQQTVIINPNHNITARLIEIDHGGTVTIGFDPPEVFVPEEWKVIFIESHRTNLTVEERRSYREFSDNVFNVSFIKLSEEPD